MRLRIIAIIATLGVIAVASFATFSYANGNISACGFQQGCNATNKTVTTTTHEGNQTVVAAQIVFIYTNTLTVSGTTQTSTTTINYSCPTSVVNDKYGNSVSC